jgi:hypothetical protein
MDIFRAPFEIISARNCPLYGQDDCFLLTEKALELPMGRLSCLILVRELTNLLFSLMPHVATNFAEYKDVVFTCGDGSMIPGFNGSQEFYQIGFHLHVLQIRPVIESFAVGVDRIDGYMGMKAEKVSDRVVDIMDMDMLEFFFIHGRTGKGLQQVIVIDPVGFT